MNAPHLHHPLTALWLLCVPRDLSVEQRHVTV